MSVGPNEVVALKDAHRETSASGLAATAQRATDVGERGVLVAGTVPIGDVPR